MSILPDTAKTMPKRQPRAAKSSSTKTKKSCETLAANPTPSAMPAGKIGALIVLLMRSEGATLAAMMDATGWQAHSVRGAMAGTIKKKLKLTVTSEKIGDVRSWRIQAGQA
jgi:hypothetical protein